MALNVNPTSIVRLEVSLPEFVHRFVDVQLRRIVLNTVLAHRVNHHIERNSGLDQLIGETSGILRMHVVVVSSVHQQQAAVQIRGTFGTGCGFLPLCVILRTLHVAFRIDCIVKEF